MPRRSGLVVLAMLAMVGVGGAVAAGGVDDFIARHWRSPLSAQGPAPEHYSAVEASLDPRACGSCHPVQFADWSTSIHARAMGPGLTGQLVEMLEHEPAAALACYTCHAPLAEQAPLVRGPDGIEKNPAYDPALRTQGVVCAACHVRAHERFGPPRRDGSMASVVPRETLPHGGVTRTAAFRVSAFCARCHQFGPRGYALNGKLLQDTHNEWASSRYAREGVQCQDCHMPDRRHVWRGIHDPDMVRAGITVTLEPATENGLSPELAARLTVENTGVGHAFPTYVTPRVVLRGELLDAAGRTIPGTVHEHAIERHIALDLSQEFSDTRLLPGQRAVLEYRRTAEPGAARVRFTVVVFPGAFYTRFFEALLAEGAGRGAGDIRRALEETRRSAFTVFEREISLR